MTDLLDTINTPTDLRALAPEDLPLLAAEIRAEMIRTVSVTGGHLGASLGVVELTLALHTVFNTPEDKLVWDVGHQAYAHKMVTGRREAMQTLRQGGGLSGFTKRSESACDPFGAGHSSTSISAALGLAVARDLEGETNRRVIAVIGDGAMSGGMAYEAMNNAGALKSRLLVVLNDNEMSIAQPVGAMSAHLSRLISSPRYEHLRQWAREMAGKVSRRLTTAAERAEEYARGMVSGGTLFEELGFYYVGPIDGHNFEHLLPVLKNIRDSDHKGPVLLHVITQKGKGYAPAEAAPDKMHGVGCFDIETGEPVAAKTSGPTYTDVFGKTLVACAQKDPRILAITAAMPSGTGLDRFAKEFSQRFFDVGIAEQHAVTFAAALATEGFKPFVTLYSSFLQRAYDQVIHDCALQKLPVRFALDRAGLVGADGPTHAGAYDIAFLSCIPGLVLMAAADESELARMVATAAAYNEGPIAFRYPRGTGPGAVVPEAPEALDIGKGRIVREGSRVAIVSLGARLAEVMKAADLLEAEGISCTVADARFAKPLDEDLILRLARNHEALFTVEDGAPGGFGAHVLGFLASCGLLDGKLKVRTLCLPDAFIPHDSPAAQYASIGLDAKGIAGAVREVVS